MCFYSTIVIYTCGHEEVMETGTASPLCIYGAANDDSCGTELGCVLIMESRSTTFCTPCSRVAQSLRKSTTSQHDFVPRVTAAEAQKQAENRDALLRDAGGAPKPPANRVEQLNRMAKGNLDNFLAHHPEVLESYANVMWLVFFIAALPGWLDRPALAAALEPWFATLFNETLQFCVRPALRNMGCEYTLNDIMCWQEEKTVWLT
ncbi:hypothetical protein GGR53DRAFT_462648 [Hypoxylon sp. FL1150]|nr:hypothetical protein GGR53DRAFT_462648 [Hypoxylon sp. FL1150]